MRDLGRTDEAVELYERRAAMGGWDEEVAYALLQAGILTADAGDWPAAAELLTRAWEARPGASKPATNWRPGCGR
ncbi:hypothetical protein ABZO31_21520 [Streptomyces sp. HUAS MG47]|uniref:hypothetical protein n=1 Tax=Streptomyces solicamelliae TaxID=3231716 RepID=UPI003877E6BA